MPCTSARRAMQHEKAKKHKAYRATDCGSPSARQLASVYFGACAEEQSYAILQELEGSSGASALASCFRNFLREAGITPVQGGPTLSQKQPDHKRKHQSPKPPDTELMLHVTLEELYHGAVKWVPVERKKHDGLGHVVPVQERLQIRVQPGLKEGTRITLPGLGHQDNIGNLSDLTFIVQQQLHPAFRRLKDDLYAIVNVPLVTALTGGPVSLRTLGGQLLQLPIGDDVITPGSELVVPNQGMPVFGDSTGRRGVLHVRFNVSFPKHLSRQQQLQLRHALAGCECQPSLKRLPVLPPPSQQQWQQVHVAREDEQLLLKKRSAPTELQTTDTPAGGSSSGCSSGFGLAAAAAAAAGRAAAVSGATEAGIYCAAAAASSSTAASAGSTSVAGFACTHSTGTSGGSWVT